MSEPGPRATWRNWFGNVTAEPRRVVHPASTDELAETVVAAARAGLPVRPAGAGHSNTPLVATEGVVVALDRMSGLTAVDPGAGLATFRPGTPVGAIGPALWRHGLSLANQGDIDTQQLAGAVGTGTHGSGITLGSFSGALQAARLVTADGDVREVGPDPELVRAARTSLGALGVLSELTVTVVPAFALELTVEVTRWEDLLERWDDLLAGHRSVTFLWSVTGRNPWVPSADRPGSEQVVIKSTDARPPGTPRRGEKYRTAFVAPAYEVWPDVYARDFHELEFMVPVAAGPTAAADIRDLVRREFDDLPFPVEIRFVRADDAMLSPTAGRASCVVSVCGPLGTDNNRLFRACDRVLRPYGARPHWGKWHRHTAVELAGVYPELAAFGAVRERLDPGGTFLNDHLRTVLGVRAV